MYFGISFEGAIGAGSSCCHCRSSFVVRRSSFVVRRSSFVVRRSSFVVRRWSLSVSLLVFASSSLSLSSLSASLSSLSSSSSSSFVAIDALRVSLCHWVFVACVFVVLVAFAAFVTFDVLRAVASVCWSICESVLLSVSGSVRLCEYLRVLHSPRLALN